MSSPEPVYLDYAATTPLDRRVASRMQAVWQSGNYNPSSNHIAGRRSAAVVAQAAEQLATLLNVDARSIVWTSGATESNNLAIRGIAEQRRHRGRHLVTMRTEHKAVVDVFKHLEKNGFDVSWLDPDENGVLPLARVSAALRDDTQLVSVMHVNNETGAIQDLAGIGAVCRDKGVLFHSDGAQAAGKIPLDLETLPVDLYSLTAHKFYGPKGIGALVLGNGARPAPILFGGGQQLKLRPGTLAVDLIAGMGEAAEVAKTELSAEHALLQELKTRLLDGLQQTKGVYVNGPSSSAYPGILNVGVPDIEGESLMLALEPLCVATGSACNSQSRESSYVLRALGRSDQQAQSSIRFSFGRFTTRAEIELAADLYRDAVARPARYGATGRAIVMLPIEPYSDRVRELFANARHVGEVTDGVSAYFADQGLRLRLSAATHGETVTALKFLAYGCPHLIAATEAICRHFEGRPINDLEDFNCGQIMEDLAVPVEKTGRILVLEDTVRSLRAAISDHIAG